MRTFIAVIFLLAIGTGCATTSKSELDAEVKRLCAIDGGVKVYEKVIVQPQDLDRFGTVDVSSKAYAKPGDKYYYELQSQFYRTGNPEMRRDRFLLYRASDHKLLAEAVSYARRGGDVPSPMHESSFRCPRDSGMSALKDQVFVISRER